MNCGATARDSNSFTINQDATSNSNQGTERLRITTGGNVGIGTNSPASNYKLDVSGDLSLGEDRGTDNTYLDQKQDGDLHIINSGRTSNGATVTSAGGVGINSYNTIAGGTSLFRDFTVYNGKNSKVLVVDGSESRVGVGTDDPKDQIHIVTAETNTTSVRGLRISNNASGAGTGAEIALGAGTGAVSTAAAISGIYDGTGTAFSVKVSSSYASSAYTERFRVEHDGTANFWTGNDDYTNPDIGGSTTGVSIGKNVSGQIYACVDDGSGDYYKEWVMNLSRRDNAGDGPQLALDRRGWVKASIAGLQGGNTASSGPGQFAIYTHNYATGSHVATERFRIDASGHIHTGYTSSFGSDHVNILATDGGGISIGTRATGSASANDVLGSLSFQGYLSGQTQTSSEAKISAVAETNHSGSSAGTGLYFYIKNDSTGPGSNPQEGMRLNRNGALILLREHLQISRDASNTSGFTKGGLVFACLLYTSPSPRDRQKSRMPSSA